MFKLKPFLLKSGRTLVRHQTTCPAAKIPSNTKLTTLPNGMKVATELTKSPMAHIALFVEAGSRYEKTSNNGIFYFIEHLVYKGFKGMDKPQLEKLLLTNGMKFSITTGRELQIFSAKCLLECYPSVIEIFSRIISLPSFSDSEIEKERQNISLELLDAENDAKQVLFDYLHQTAFQGTPLAQRVIGPKKNLDAFDSVYCENIMKEHYQPYKLALVSSGPIKHEEMLHNVETHFGSLESNPAGQSDEGPCRFTGSEVLFRDDSLPFTHVALAVEAPGFNTVEYWTMFTAACMIGSWDRSQGRGPSNPLLLAQAGDTGLCERYEAFYIPYRDVGLWGVYFVGDRMHLENMVYNIQRCFMALCTTVTFNEVKRGINEAKLKLARSVQGGVDSCLDVGLQVMYRGKRQSLQESYDLLSSVKHSALKAVCDKYLYDRCPAVAAVGPTEGLPEYNRIRGGMYWLRL